MMAQSRSRCNVENSIIVDCHNSFTPESGEVLPGNSEVFQLIDVIDSINPEQPKYEVKIGCYENTMGDLGKTEGIGESGIKTIVIEVDDQRTAYVLFDSNNMIHIQLIHYPEDIIQLELQKDQKLLNMLK